MITKIEVRRKIKGYRRTPNGKQPVYFRQRTLLVNDGKNGRMRQAGYMSPADGGNISLIRRFSDEELRQIHALVQAEHGRRMFPGQPPDDPEDSEDPEETDDDDDET